MMKDMVYGEEYQYAHNFEDAFVAGENYLPQALAEMEFYHPVNRGLEIQIGEKLARYREMNSASAFQRYGEKAKDHD